MDDILLVFQFLVVYSFRVLIWQLNNSATSRVVDDGIVNFYDFSDDGSWDVFVSVMSSYFRNAK